MRNKAINRLLTVCFIILISISIFLMGLSMINIDDTTPWIQGLKSNAVNISTWILTVVFGVISIKLRRPVLKREQYCFDRYFIDRVEERNVLFTFLESKKDEDRALFIVKGGMCRGKTTLLQRFADDVNGYGSADLFREQGKWFRKYAAYYVEIDSCSENILCEISKALFKNDNLDTYDKLTKFLKKASYRKNTVLLIDNISRMQDYLATETACKLLYKNPTLKIILSITEENFAESPVRKPYTLIPPLFGEMHINELAKAFHKDISIKMNKEIVRISNGIPSYVIMIFKTGILDKPITLSNFEDMQNVVQMQLLRLGTDRFIVDYLVCLKLCYDGPISKGELISLSKASEHQLEKVFDMALAEERIIDHQAYVFMNELLVKCCLKTVVCSKYLPEIYSFYQSRNTDIALVASIIQSDNLKTEKIKKALKEKYNQGKFLIFTKLGSLDQDGMLCAFHNDIDLYNFFRFYHLSSLLQLGEYSLAISTLKLYEKSTISLPPLQHTYTQWEFDLQYLIIDLHHLSNQFRLALAEIEAILSQEERLSKGRQYKLLYLQAHCLKHLGNQLADADHILAYMQTMKLPNTLKIKVLYSRLSIHMFWGDSKFNYDSIIRLLQELVQKETPEWAHTLRHIAYYKWTQTGSAEDALKIIDIGLEVLRRTRWRIIYDFYFERAEWMRIRNNEAKNTIYEAKDILSFYEKALDFAIENNDINLACCVRLGKILTCLPHKGESVSWRKEQLTTVNREFLKMNDAGLEINKTYAQYMRFLLLGEKPTQEFIRYCEVNRFYNLGQHITNQENLKLTVM